MMAQNILVMNLTRMGDLIQSTPLIAGLRKKYPDAAITLLVSHEFAEFARRIPFITDIIVYDIGQLKRKMDASKDVTWVDLYRYLESLLREIMERQFDQVFNLSHSKLSALMISYLGIKNVRGFFCNETGDRMTHHPWLQYFGIEQFNRTYNSFNLADIYIRAGDVEPDCGPVMIKTDAADFSSADEILQKENIGGDDFLIGFQAGSSLEGRRWPTRSFAELGDLLSANLNAKIVLLGVKSESKLAQEVAGLMKMKHRVIDLTGRTSITQLIAVLKRCSYLVTNDTGTMHIAAALGTKIVGLFFAHAHPYETGPYAPGHVIFQARIACAPCSYGIQCNNVVCVQKVHPADVFSVMELHRKNGTWKAPDHLMFPEEMDIVQTCFDEDHLLKFKPLIKRPVTKQDILILAYRKMWLNTLADETSGGNRYNAGLETLVQSLVEDFDVTEIHRVLEDLRLELNAFRELVQVGKKGIKAAEKIKKLLLRNQASPERIGESAEKIKRFDERINLLGMTYPQVKPVTDMFNKRKENLNGDDVLRLAGETKKYYRQLAAESARIIEIVAHLVESFDSPLPAAVQVEFNSIKTAVPGK